MTNEQYQEAIDWLFVQMPNYQIDGQKAYKPDLTILQSFVLSLEILRIK
jgi:hypothetical protein